MDSITIKFPKNEEEKLEFGKPIVLLGANGAGKTRFSVKIEELNDPAFSSNFHKESNIHRLSAQKSLTISTSIPIYDYESSERNLFLGTTDRNANKSAYRFHNNPVTNLLNDFQQVLSLLFAEVQCELQREHNEAKQCGKEGKTIPVPADTVVDKAKKYGILCSLIELSTYQETVFILSLTVKNIMEKR